MSIRLAYLVSQYPTLSHTFILREIRALRELGFDIEVVSIRPPDRPLEKMGAEEREEAGRTWTVFAAGLGGFAGAHLATFLTRPASYLRGLASAVALGGWDLRAAFFNAVYFAEAIMAGRRILGRGFTHLHTHFSSTVALLLGRVFPITVSATIHGSAEFDNPLLFYLSEKVTEARFLCTISQYGRSQLMRAGQPEDWDKIEVAPLGVDPELFAPRPHRAAPERFEIVSVGRLAAAKGYPILIEAVALLVAEGRTALRLRIAGGGEEHAALKRHIERLSMQAYVTLEGACSHEKVRQIYAETDVFAMASLAEGVPVVLMEAMAMEIPCIAPWIMGIPELIRHGESGWLVPPADARALAEGIAYLMDRPELRERLGKAGRVGVEEGYHLGKNVRRLGEIFRRRL